MVPVSDAVADKHAVVLPLEDADAADGAVPGAGRLHRLAAGAELPSAAPGGAGGRAAPSLGVGGGAGRRQDDVAGRGVRQPETHEVAHNVEQEEGSHDGMQVEGDGALAVEGGEDQLQGEERSTGGHTSNSAFATCTS